MADTNSYAGGSNLDNLDDFKNYINGKEKLGSCDPEETDTCYWNYYKNAHYVENILLALGFGCNVHNESNLEEGKKGYVYVIK